MMIEMKTFSAGCFARQCRKAESQESDGSKTVDDELINVPARVYKYS